jgi:Xaa-Pro aminopeptidase
MSALGPDSVLVLWSAPPRVYSTDTNYEYRQESNLLYLTGIDQPETVLVLVPGGFASPPEPESGVTSSEGAAREFLFTSAVDPRRELWEGRVLRPAEVTARSGITDVRTQRRTEAFDAFMESLIGPAAASSPFGQALAAGRARLTILEAVPEAGPDPEPADLHVGRQIAWVRAMQRKAPGLRAASAEPLLDRQRSIKTPYEQALLRRGVQISSEAHVAGMRATRPGRWEYEVEAAIEHEWHRQGALSWGYPSIVASGPNATTLHYISSTRQMQDGELLLVDAAGNYQGLTGDITRTYPVSGRFTPDQRAIYELVLRAADAGVAAARPGAPVSAISRAVRGVLGPGLLELGLVTDPAAAKGEGPQISWWAPHSPTHGIGVDVHDPLLTLDPGAAFVVEPGLYFRPDVLERIAAAPETREVADIIRPAVMRYLNMGVRIEDSFIMTASGAENLSVRVPRTVSELEATVGTGR